MSSEAQRLAKKSEELMAPSRSTKLAVGGVKTDREFAALMSAIIGDVAEGTLSTERANAMVNAGGKLLKCVEMRLRWGSKEGDSKRLALID